MSHRRITSLNRRARAIVVSGASAVLAGLALLAGASAVAATPKASFYLDSYNPNNRSGGSVAQSPIEFLRGRTYTVVVEGTFSAWGYWPRHRYCGAPERRAMFASPLADHRPSTPVGFDAVTQFARPHYNSRACGSELPRPSQSFQMNVGHGWQFFRTVSGTGPITLGLHKYAITLVGTGTRPGFRIGDWHPSDNNGEFKITLSN